MGTVDETAPSGLEGTKPSARGAPLASLGDTIDGRYTVDAQLGAGAMGVVVRARERLLDRPVALKIIAPTWAHHERFDAAFLDEARAMAQLRHPNVVQIHTVGEHGDAYYMAMELVQGSSLAEIVSEHLDRGERLSLLNALALLGDVIEGAQAIHEAGLLHCDLKPANVVVEAGTGRPVIIDFGLATRVEDADMRGGTPAYMSAERVDRAAPITVQSDIYSLGVTAYELLTGCLPFLARRREDLMEMHRSLAVPLMAELFEELAPFDPIVQRAMAKSPGDRFTSCAEMAVALTETKEQWAQSVTPASPPPVLVDDGAAISVLVVDDDPAIRRAVARAAKLAPTPRPLRLVPASTGEHAVAIARHRMPSIIVLDYQLPGLDGVATLSAIRSLPKGYDVRVVVVSGSVNEVRWRFQALGVTDFFSKPMGLDDLVDALHRLSSKSPRPRAPLAVPTTH